MRRSTVRFALTLLALLFALTVLARTPWMLREVRDPIRSGLAHAVSAVVGLFGHETQVEGFAVVGHGGTVEIVYDCDGVGLAVFFVSATLAAPISARLRIVPGIAWGVLVIGSLNVVRLAALAWLYLLGYRDAFEFIHTYLFQGFLIVATVVAWAAWVVWAQGPRPEPT